MSTRALIEFTQDGIVESQLCVSYAGAPCLGYDGVLDSLVQFLKESAVWLDNRWNCPVYLASRFFAYYLMSNGKEYRPEFTGIVFVISPVADVSYKLRVETFNSKNTKNFTDTVPLISLSLEKEGKFSEFRAIDQMDSIKEEIVAIYKKHQQEEYDKWSDQQDRKYSILR